MTQKIMENLYRLTDGKPLKEIPVQLLKISCRNASMDFLSKRLNDLETLGYVNTYKKTIENEPRILLIELTTYGKILFEKENPKVIF
ncbi:MAG TPA: hypothetical protein VLJ60_11455 [bacterium]|nr:hypothetical protein [bacterium]